MSHTTIRQEPHQWNSVHRPIIFERGTGVIGGAEFIEVIDEAGFAKFKLHPGQQFALSGLKRIFVQAGIYKGYHRVDSVPDGQHIITFTEFAGNDFGDIIFVLPTNLELHYGYPTQDNIITIRSSYNFEGKVIDDISPFLASTFRILPPTIGFDENMYTHFRLYIVSADQITDDYIVAAGEADAAAFFDWNGDDHLFYALNGACDQEYLNCIVPANGLEKDPVIFNNHCTIYSIISGTDMDRIFNVESCQGVVEGGIGFMQVCTDFQISGV